jgi:uncharacterized protein
MDRLRNSFFLLVGLSVVAWSFYTFLNRPAPAKYQTQDLTQPSPNPRRGQTQGAGEVGVTGHTLRIGNYVLPVEVLDTEESRKQGFSGRERPASGHGLLFVFEKPGVYGFWMKDMRFDIDIIWINESWQVVSVDAAVRADSYPHIFNPTAPSKYVLELPSGDAAAFGIDTGSKLYLDR